MTGRSQAGGPGPAVWGYCQRCELWRLSAAWGEPPACPDCGASPDPLERWADGRGRVLLRLILPPGTDLPLLG